MTPRGHGSGSSLGLAAVAAALALLSSCARNNDPPTAASAAGTQAASRHGKILYWKSTMDPTFISKKPGKDSMGMELVPVYEGEEPQSEPGVVRIDPATEQDIGVKTVSIHRQPLAHTIRTVGRIAYDESLVRSIAPKIDGWVERQHVSFPGQVVRKGEPLVSIYSPKLVSTEEEYLLALRYQKQLADSTVAGAASDANDLVRSAETRLRYWDITEGQIKALAGRGTIARTMVLHAPFDGIVLTKDVLEGGYVDAGHSLYTLADISTVWVYADVYEYEAPWLKLGQEAAMTLAYQPGVTYRGRVVYIYPYLKEQTRTLQVRIQVRNSRDFALKPGMWSDVTLESAVAREGIGVPVQAVIRTGVRNIALVALGGGRFAPRELKLGAQAGDDFEVIGGLKEGDQVVTSAQFLIDSESNLKAAISKMLDSGAAAGGPVPLPGPGVPAPQMNMPGMNMAAQAASPQASPAVRAPQMNMPGMNMNMPGMDMPGMNMSTPASGGAGVPDRLPQR